MSDELIRGAVSDAVQRRVAWLRRLPVAMRGKARLARWLLGDLPRASSCEIRHRDRVWVEVPGFGDSIAFFLLIDGVYEPRELDWLDRLAEPGTWVIDVGANVGALTLPLASRRKDLTGVLAVEPSQWISGMLERSVQRNGLDRVLVLPIAAGASDGEGWFDAGLDAFGQGHVAAEAADNRVKVPLRTIDSILSERSIHDVSVMKIDVEGGEYDVLAGAVALLAGSRPVAILFEFYAPDDGSPAAHEKSAQALLLACGFRLFVVRHDNRLAELTTPVASGFFSLLALRNDDPRLSKLASVVS